METGLLIAYDLVAGLLFVYNLGQFSLIVKYLTAGRTTRTALVLAKPVFPGGWPMVTVQLPVYNERYVVERLIDAVAALNYPADKLHIQVLDDSTDDSTALITSRVTHSRWLGIEIEHIRRGHRAGYKAGALAHGLTTATGEFIAIFDADFVPDPDFLLNTIPHFADATIGAIQTRWTYLNRDYSLLTQIQGFGLDAHFVVEQRGRNAAGLLMNFNGTGGIWRKAAILDAGGWQADTLTEDLDLSYRAQLRGWRFAYREDLSSPGELPVTMAALRSQQYRWMKGAAECVRKLARPLLTAQNVSLSAKLHGLLHLLSSSMFALLLLLSILSVPVLIGQHQQRSQPMAFDPGSLFTLNLVISLLLYGLSYRRIRAESGMRIGSLPDVFKFLGLAFLYASLMLGLSLYNTMAVVAGYRGWQTPFVRTPKFNLNSTAGHWQTNVYHRQRVPPIIWVEGLLLAYFGLGLGLGVYWHDYRMLPFHTLLVAGYSLVVGYSLAQAGPFGGLGRSRVAKNQEAVSDEAAGAPIHNADIPA